MLQSGRISQVHEQEVVFISCSSQAGWARFFTKRLYSCHVPVIQYPVCLEHHMNTTSWSRTWLILYDWDMTWIQPLGKEPRSSCLTGAWHEYNFLFMNLTYPAWLEHDVNTTSCSWTWLILPDYVMSQSYSMSQVLDQEVVFMWCSRQTGWVKFMTRKLYSCTIPVRQDESSSWTGGCIIVMLHSGRMSQVHAWLILPDWSMTWIQLPGQELDSFCLTQA
jgi:hypothetical protein